MKIMLVTDAWHPQVNGVVRTLTRVIEECEAMGHTFEVVSPADGFKTIPLPTYNEIQLAVGAKKAIVERFNSFEPEAVHIATEGTLGMAARAMCLKMKFPFTTSYHTLSGICVCTFPCAAELGVFLHALVPPLFRSCDGGDPVHA